MYRLCGVIEDPAVVRKILDHLGPARLAGRAPPVTAVGRPTRDFAAEPFYDDLPWGEQAIVG